MIDMRTMAVAAAAIVAAAAAGADAQVVVSAGADHASGTYGTGQRIESTTASIGVRAKRKRVTAFATLPFVQTRAPGNVVVTGGLFGLPVLVDPTRPATRVRRSGVGDANVGLSLQLTQPRDGAIALAISATAKLPTASTAKGLGTGKTDVGIAADIARPGKITPFAGVGYTLVGRPEAYRLNDVASAKGGVALRVGTASEIALSYNYASRISDTVADRQELGLGGQTALSQRLTLGVQGSAGLSRGAPGAGGGVRLGFRL